MKPCDPEIFEHGKAVAIIADRSAQKIEDLIVRVAGLSYQRIDWHYVAGRGVVRCIGNCELVRGLLRRYTNGYFKIVEENGEWTI